MTFLPQKIRWVDISDIEAQGTFSYRECLIVTHKHSVRDWFIVHGWIHPIDDYKDFKVMAKTFGLPSSYPDVEISKQEIIKIGFVQSYGHITDTSTG